MTYLKSWLLGIVAAAMAVTLADALAGSGRLKNALRACGGVLLFLAVFRPVADWSTQTFSWRIQDAEAMTRTQIAAYEEEHERSMETIIKEKCCAYISETGAELGLACKAQVECRAENGTPLPFAVTLDIPFDPRLSRRIEAELGIGAQHQHWQEG